MNTQFYFDKNTWKLSLMEEPKEKPLHLVRVSPILALMVAPLLGALLVMFLPFVGFSMVIVAGVEKVKLIVRNFNAKVSFYRNRKLKEVIVEKNN